jgi:hypothetical protein
MCLCLFPISCYSFKGFLINLHAFAMSLIQQNAAYYMTLKHFSLLYPCATSRSCPRQLAYKSSVIGEKTRFSHNSLLEKVVRLK